MTEPTTMKVRLFSTCLVESDRLEKLVRMLASVDAAVAALGQGLDIKLYLLLQRHDGGAIPIAVAPYVVLLTTPDLVSLSGARNRILGEAAKQGPFDGATLVAFPDDDCWYPPGVLETILAQFQADPALDFWFCRYSSTPKAAADVDFGDARPAQVATTVRNASSNTLFFRGPVMERVGRFDERLGVGTPFGGSEDLDVALTAKAVARKTLYLDAAVIGHRDKSDTVRERYFRSALLVLACHLAHGTWSELLRKCLVGAVLVVQGKLAINVFLKALGEASVAAVSGTLPKG